MMAWTEECREKYRKSQEWHTAYVREWRKKNLEKIREKERERYHRVLKHKPGYLDAKKAEQKEKRKRRTREQQEKINIRARAFYERNPEKHAEYQRRWRDANPEKIETMRKRTKLKAKYGISLEQFDAMYNAQNGKCANDGCNASGSNRGRDSLVVDHCHVTGKVRGLLCVGCNFALGHLEDSPERAIGLASYLKKEDSNAI